MLRKIVPYFPTLDGVRRMTANVKDLRDPYIALGKYTGYYLRDWYEDTCPACFGDLQNNKCIVCGLDNTELGLWSGLVSYVHAPFETVLHYVNAQAVQAAHYYSITARVGKKKEYARLLKNVQDVQAVFHGMERTFSAFGRLGSYLWRYRTTIKYAPWVWRTNFGLIHGRRGERLFGTVYNVNDVLNRPEFWYVDFMDEANQGYLRDIFQAHGDLFGTFEDYMNSVPLGYPETVVKYLSPIAASISTGNPAGKTAGKEKTPY